MTKKPRKQGSGGARKGAGRPKKAPKEFSDDVKRRYIKAARELAEEYGEPIEKAILRLLYTENVMDTCKVGVAKLYNEVLVVKESEQTITTKEVQTPQVYLPEELPDPAKIIQIEEGKNKPIKLDEKK